MQASKKNTYVLSDIISVSEGDEELSTMPDTLRKTLGKHWVGTNERGKNNSLEYGDNEKYEDFLRSKHLNMFYGKVVTRMLRNPPFVSKQQRICFKGSEDYWDRVGYQNWLELMEELTPNLQYTLKDYSFRIDTPFDQRERKRIGDVSALGFIDVDFVYNYHNPRYEESINNIREEYLPNLYSFITDDVSRNMQMLKTLKGTIDGKLAQIKKKAWNKANEINPLLGTEWIYFNLVSKAYKKAKERFMEDFYVRFQNFIVPFENLDLISDSTLKDSFPMFVEIKFSTDSVTEVAQMLEDASLSTSLQRHVAAGCGGMNATLLNLLGGGQESYYVAKQNLSYSNDHNGGIEVSAGKYKYIDLMTWWKRYMAGFTPSVYANQTFIGPNTRSVYISAGAQKNNLSQALSLLIFSGKLRDIVKDNTRSIEQILEGDTCHTETVIYRVAKYRGNPENGQPVQNYWFPNSNKIDVLEMVDTQVKYNKTYTYKVFAYQLVIGSEYNYGALHMAPTPEPEFIETCPDIEMPTLNGVVVIDPPSYPDTSLAREDAFTVMDTFTVLGTDTAREANVATALITVYVFAGMIEALSNYYYFQEVVATIANEYGFNKLSFAATVLSAANSYATGEISEITVPSVLEQLPPEYNYGACIDVISYPCVKLVEVPFFTHTGIMVDSPPLSPDVNIIPYRGKNNKVLIWLNSTVGEQELYPIPIYRSERRYIEEIRRNKFLSPTDKITYRSDDNATAFEVFRLKEKPEKYPNFANNRRFFLTTMLETESFKRASAVSVVDDILPNQKYYYAFRTVDVHGNRSNPTKVYEIQLVDNDGAVYMLTNIIDLEEKTKPHDPIKQARRYVHIVPRVTQAVFNKARSGLDEASSALDTTSYALGVEDESIWGKRFKVRFISKSTGKKIDLNITYGRGHKITPEEEELRNGP